MRCALALALIPLLLAALGAAPPARAPQPPQPPQPTPAIAAADLPFPILFVTQVPIPDDFTTVGSVFGNHRGEVESAGRGGDLYILYPGGKLRNLTREAGLGSKDNQGFQGADAIAVREPTVHWSGTRALFSMVVGATTERPAGSVGLAADGSAAAFVPARRALSWQLLDTAGQGVVRERYWLTFQPGEVRVCTSCHGLNARDQAGRPQPAKSPEALRALLRYWKNELGGGGAGGGCQPGPTALCLNGGRLRVEVAWKDFAGNTGVGMASPLTGDTGTFWFFNPANVELVVKVLDGRALNDRWWVFFGALSNVEYDLTVTDTATGAHRTWHNPAGRLASVAETSAFPAP